MTTEKKPVGDAPVLFLHGGPGMTAALERQRFGTSLAIHWWDQPRLAAGVGDPFQTIVEAARRQVRELSDDSEGLIALLASSFGARLALELQHLMPDAIGAVTICGGVLELRQSFLRLGSFFARKLSSLSLKQLVSAAAMSNDPEALAALIGAITAIPDFTDDYWTDSASAQRAAMRALAAQGTLVDARTFQAIVTASDALTPRPVHADGAAKVLVLIGRLDPLAEVGDAEYWQHFWPSATVKFVDSGHFPHLELPPDTWMPRL